MGQEKVSAVNSLLLMTAATVIGGMTVYLITKSIEERQAQRAIDRLRESTVGDADLQRIG